MMNEKMDKHLVIRCTKEQKQQLTDVAKSYGMRPTQLGRHLILKALQNSPVVR